jgi:phage terminase small subunit
MALTARQARFVEEFLVDCNAAAAYRRAGYTCLNERVASANAARLIAKDSVRSEIEARREERSRKMNITAADVVAGLHKEATLAGEGSSHAARVTAWSWLGKHLAMFAERHEHTFPDSDVDAALHAELQRLSAGRAGEGDGPLPPPRGPGEPAGNGRHDG